GGGHRHVGGAEGGVVRDGEGEGAPVGGDLHQPDGDGDGAELHRGGSGDEVVTLHGHHRQLRTARGREARGDGDAGGDGEGQVPRGSTGRGDRHVGRPEGGVAGDHELERVP